MRVLSSIATWLFWRAGSVCVGCVDNKAQCCGTEERLASSAPECDADLGMCCAGPREKLMRDDRLCPGDQNKTGAQIRQGSWICCRKESVCQNQKTGTDECCGPRESCKETELGEACVALTCDRANGRQEAPCVSKPLLPSELENCQPDAAVLEVVPGPSTGVSGVGRDFGRCPSKEAPQPRDQRALEMEPETLGAIRTVQRWDCVHSSSGNPCQVEADESLRRFALVGMGRLEVRFKYPPLVETCAKYPTQVWDAKLDIPSAVSLFKLRLFRQSSDTCRVLENPVPDVSAPPEVLVVGSPEMFHPPGAVLTREMFPVYSLRVVQFNSAATGTGSTLAQPGGTKCTLRWQQATRPPPLPLDLSVFGTDVRYRQRPPLAENMADGTPLTFRQVEMGQLPGGSLLPPQQPPPSPFLSLFCTGTSPQSRATAWSLPVDSSESRSSGFFKGLSRCFRRDLSSSSSAQGGSDAPLAQPAVIPKLLPVRNANSTQLGWDERLLGRGGAAFSTIQREYEQTLVFGKSLGKPSALSYRYSLEGCGVACQQTIGCNAFTLSGNGDATPTCMLHSNWSNDALEDAGVGDVVAVWRKKARGMPEDPVPKPILATGPKGWLAYRGRCAAEPSLPEVDAISVDDCMERFATSGTYALELDAAAQTTCRVHNAPVDLANCDAREEVITWISSRMSPPQSIWGTC